MVPPTAPPPELELGLDAIGQVVDRELTLGDVAAQHAAALEAQIGILRPRRAVLTAVAKRGPTPEEMERGWSWAELSLDPDFRAGVRRGAREHAAGLPDSALRRWMLRRLTAANDRAATGTSTCSPWSTADRSRSA
nr:hypothetical protein [Streptomyces cyaneochromogenes]